LNEVCEFCCKKWFEYSCTVPSGSYKKLTKLNLDEKSGIILRNQSKWAGDSGRVAQKIAAMPSLGPMFRPKVIHLFCQNNGGKIVL
jgi:hypothetical protein